MKTSRNYLSQGIFLMTLSVGAIWLRSGMEKFSGGTFVDTIAVTLGNFAKKNPFPWYKDFLQTVAIPNAEVFGLLVLWGEFLTGVSIAAACVYLILKPNDENKTISILLLTGLFFGTLMNLNYWLASGWMSKAVDNLNLLMLAIQLVSLILVVKLRFKT